MKQAILYAMIATNTVIVTEFALGPYVLISALPILGNPWYCSADGGSQGYTDFSPLFLYSNFAGNFSAHRGRSALSHLTANETKRRLKSYRAARMHG